MRFNEFIELSFSLNKIRINCKENYQIKKLLKILLLKILFLIN